MEPFLGKRYKLKTSEKFEEYMEFVGVSYIHRKTVAALSPVYILTRNDDGSYTLTFETILRNHSITFKPDEEFEETRADSDKLKSIIRFEGNKFIHIQEETNGRITIHERVFTENTLTVTTTVEGWADKCERTFELVQ